MTEDGPTLVVRTATDDDMNFIAASWFESFWKGAMRDTGMPFMSYKAGQDALIRRLVKASTVVVVAAAVAPDEIVGYAVREGPVAHYVYVKQAYRRLGIGKRLVEGCLLYTHQTRAGERVARSIDAQYDPYALYAPEDT